MITVAELIEQLQKLPRDLVVEAEGCDRVNRVRGAGVYRLKPGDTLGPRCILVCDADFYGVLGPSLNERRGRPLR